MDWILDILRTWGHILVGLSVLLIAFVCSWKFFSWCETLKRQFDRDKKLSERPQPWRYQ